MTFGLQQRLRSLATLGALTVLLLVGVTWGWSAVTAPLPRTEDPPICENTALAAGDKVYPDQVTISVLNAGTRQGLASRTMQQLVDRGFVQGENANAPARADVAGAEIWTEDPTSAAVRLVATYLAKNGRGVAIREAEAEALGINVIVGDEFTQVVKGRRSLTARTDATICSPPSSQPPSSQPPSN
jgi:hypothetical protein